MMRIIKLRSCSPTVLRRFVTSSSEKCDVISSGCYPGGVSGESAEVRLSFRRFIASSPAKCDVIISGRVSGDVFGDLAASRLNLRRFVTSSPAKRDVISSGGVSGESAAKRTIFRGFIASSPAKRDVISSDCVSGELVPRRLNLRRFVTSSPAKCDVISSGCDSGESAWRRLNLRRFVTSSSENCEAMSSGSVSGELAAEYVCFNDEAVASTAVKSSVLPTLLQPRVVIYDGVCHLCHRGVKLVINADKHRKIKFCCLQSKAAEPYLRICGVDREDVLRRFLFIEGPYEYHQGSTAALKVLSYLPLPYSALSTLMIIPTPIRDLAYDYIAKKRYDWFGKDTNCLVLKEKELLERFIDRDEMVQKEWSDK